MSQIAKAFYGFTLDRSSSLYLAALKDIDLHALDSMGTGDPSSFSFDFEASAMQELGIPNLFCCLEYLHPEKFVSSETLQAGDILAGLVMGAFPGADRQAKQLRQRYLGRCVWHAWIASE